MKKSAFIISLVAAFWGMLAVGACADIGRDVWHYKMTVTIATPEGDKTGSSVREVTASHNLKLTPESCGYCVGLAKGEAIVVDLGKRGKVFALLRNSQGPDYAHSIFFTYLRDSPVGELVFISPQDYPEFVMFHDLDDPMTVESLNKFYHCSQHMDGDKSNICFDSELLEKYFGNGVHLKSVTIEQTKDPVTFELNNVLPWLKKIKMHFLNGTDFSRGAPLELSGGDFQKGAE